MHRVGTRRMTGGPGKGPVWPRYNEIGSGRPIFGDRDKTIHDRVEELSLERQTHYRWYNTEPQAVIDRYSEWSRRYPQTAR